MTDWHRVGAEQELRDRGASAIQIEGREIAVFWTTSGFRAVDDSCPHAGGPLSTGIACPERGTVECLWHGWSFDLATGDCRTAPTQKLGTHEVRTNDGQVEVRLRLVDS
ncbi:MAG: Rieske (2Fe-2S) protein [Planctomycetota bacterium]